MTAAGRATSQRAVIAAVTATPDQDVKPALLDRLRRLAEAERDRLRRAAREGDGDARRALEELGELPPAPPHWADVDREDEDDA